MGQSVFVLRKTTQLQSKFSSVVSVLLFKIRFRIRSQSVRCAPYTSHARTHTCTPRVLPVPKADNCKLPDDPRRLTVAHYSFRMLRHRLRFLVGACGVYGLSFIAIGKRERWLEQMIQHRSWASLPLFFICRYLRLNASAHSYSCSIRHRSAIRLRRYGVYTFSHSLCPLQALPPFLRLRPCAIAFSTIRYGHAGPVAVSSPSHIRFTSSSYICGDCR